MREVQNVVFAYPGTFALDERERGHTDLVEHSIDTGAHEAIRPTTLWRNSLLTGKG